MQVSFGQLTSCKRASFRHTSHADFYKVVSKVDGKSGDGSTCLQVTQPVLVFRPPFLPFATNIVVAKDG